MPASVTAPSVAPPSAPVSMPTQVLACLDLLIHGPVTYPDGAARPS